MIYRVPRVYLAGGMRTDWREQVKKAVPRIIYFDPTTHGLENEMDYTSWDLSAIQASDVVFAYFERDNPSGFGMMLEIGAAHVDSKYIIFVNEKTHPELLKYCGMARQVADYNATSLEDGIQHLSSLFLDPTEFSDEVLGEF